MSKKSGFDPLKLLSEIRAEPSSTAGPSTRKQDEEPDDEDDFMSDRYLPTSEPKQALTYTDKRRRLDAHHSRRDAPKSLKQREEEAREEGLERDLLAEAEIVAGGGVLPPEGKDGMRRWDRLEESEKGQISGTVREGEDGTAKAMRMMLAMGYRRGEALGKRRQEPSRPDGGVAAEEEEESDDETVGRAALTDTKAASAAETAQRNPPDDTDPESLDTDEEQALEQDRRASQAREEDEYLAGSSSAAPPTNTLIRSKQTEPLRPDQRWLGLNRRAGIGLIPKTSTNISAAILAKASSQPTSEQAATDDFRNRISRQHQQRQDFALLVRARKTLIQLDQAAGTQYNPLWLDGELYHVLSGHTPSPADATTIDEKMQRDAAFKEAVELLQLVFGSEDAERVKEAKLFVELETRAQLELVLEDLRGRHAYCLFCGCQYADKEDMDKSCPGLEEDDHD
uniref:DUF4187 domain-containing protein n=2 Tax=Kalmanozyma brasiliensis (strain GHG001) TaxID=1365824 RepID=V5ENA3_KALBG